MKLEIELTEKEFERLTDDLADIIFTLAWFKQTEMAERAVVIANKLKPTTVKRKGQAL